MVFKSLFSTNAYHNWIEEVFELEQKRFSSNKHLKGSIRVPINFKKSYRKTVEYFPDMLEDIVI